VRPGDRVVVPTHICCGFCASCAHGFSGACLTNNPGKAGAAHGYPGMGGYRGTQAELVRVPFADANCLRLPGEPGDEHEDDFVLLADALPTGYHATELARVSPGDSGAGAIGLMTALCALHLRGAGVVYVVDRVPERLTIGRSARSRPDRLHRWEPGRSDPGGAASSPRRQCLAP